MGKKSFTIRLINSPTQTRSWSITFNGHRALNIPIDQPAVFEGRAPGMVLANVTMLDGEGRCIIGLSRTSTQQYSDQLCHGNSIQLVLEDGAAYNIDATTWQTPMPRYY